LFDVGGTPGAVDVVQGDAGVDVGADPHLVGGADEHGDLAVAAAVEQPGAGLVGLGVVDVGKLVGGDAVGDEPPAKLVVGVPGAVGLGSGQVAEHDL
jgi:hypothetical protein